jgi:hypothetical protein
MGNANPSCPDFKSSLEFPVLGRPLWFLGCYSSTFEVKGWILGTLQGDRFMLLVLAARVVEKQILIRLASVHESGALTVVFEDFTSLVILAWLPEWRWRVCES